MFSSLGNGPPTKKPPRHTHRHTPTNVFKASFKRIWTSQVSSETNTLKTHSDEGSVPSRTLTIPSHGGTARPRFLKPRGLSLFSSPSEPSSLGHPHPSSPMAPLLILMHILWPSLLSWQKVPWGQWKSWHWMTPPTQAQLWVQPLEIQVLPTCRSHGKNTGVRTEGPFSGE